MKCPVSGPPAIDAHSQETYKQQQVDPCAHSMPVHCPWIAGDGDELQSAIDGKADHHWLQAGPIVFPGCLIRTIAPRDSANEATGRAAVPEKG